MKIKAVYHTEDYNPFLPNPDQVCFYTAEVPDGYYDENDLKTYARMLTPEGFVFAWIERID